MSTKNQYDIVVYTGRFSPVHIGHVETIKQALAAGKHVLVCIGSAASAPSTRNPWSDKNREKMIRLSLEDEVTKGQLTPDDLCRFTVIYLPDAPYDDKCWCKGVHYAVQQWWDANCILHDYPNPTPTVALIGYNKDDTSYYLSLFPKWGLIHVAPIAVDGVLINATDIRRHIFTGSPLPNYDEIVSPSTRKALDQYHNSNPKGIELKKRMILEFAHDDGYKAIWANSPYPVFTVAADAVVTCLDHVLLVERGKTPGRGLYAVPGGHVEPNERLVDAAIRELKEETNINVDLTTLKNHIIKTTLFDHPTRATRGRVISQAVYIELPSPDGNLPDVKAADDAVKAFWAPLSKINHQRDKFFEDHFYIVMGALV